MSTSEVEAKKTLSPAQDLPIVSLLPVGLSIEEDYIKKPGTDCDDHALSIRIDREFVNLSNIHNSSAFETLGDVSEEIDQYWAGISMVLAEDTVPDVSGPNNDSGWVKITAKRKVYSASQIRNFLLSGSVPAKNLWRETLTVGFPEDLRGNIWAYLVRAHDVAMDVSGLYSTLLIAHEEPEIDSRIEQDLARTFSDIPEFKEQSRSGKNRLFNLLKVYSRYDPEVGYCQGLNYIAAMLLLFVHDERLAFCILIQLMKSKGWRSLYTAGMPGLMRLLSALVDQMKARIPEIYNHMLRNEVQISGLFSHVFLTALIYRSSLPFAIRLFDLFMLEQENVLISAVINMLKMMKEQIMSRSFEDVHLYIKGRLVSDCIEKFSFEEIVRPLVQL